MSEIMYILKTEIYKTKDKFSTEFENFGDALIAAEHIAEVLKTVMVLTRHSSCETSINHCGYYADHYNEVFICVKAKEVDTKPELYTVLCAAFCGTGKSYLCNNFADDYMELECWEYRQGDFPNNYVNDVLNAMGKTKYLFISTDPVILKELNKRSVEMQLYYPQNELRNEYLDRFIARVSSIDFVGAVMVNWHKWINQLKEQNYCKHTILQKGEYLQDVI